MTVAELTAQRQAMVAEARSWIGTKYDLGHAMKGAGIDCARLLAECLISQGLMPREELGVYSHDWYCHASNERYMLRLIRHAPETLKGRCRGTIAADPGSLILFKVAKSRLYNHGGIITRWPFMVHAADPCVKEQNCVTHWLTGFTEFAIFDPWSKPAC